MQKFPPMISLVNFCDFMRIIRKICFFNVKCVFLVKIGHLYKIKFLKKNTNSFPTDEIWNHPTIVMQNNKLIYVLPLVVFNVIEWCLYVIPNTKAYEKYCNETNSS
jgi:hypothetical protein